MVYIVDKATNKILGRFEAWAENAIEDAVKTARTLGYKPVSDEITFMGDMVIYCEK